MKRRNRSAPTEAPAVPPALAALLSEFVPHEHLPPELLQGATKAGYGPYAIAANRFAMDRLGRRGWQLLIAGPLGVGIAAMSKQGASLLAEQQRKILSAFLDAWLAANPDYEPPTPHPDDDTEPEPGTAPDDEQIPY